MVDRREQQEIVEIPITLRLDKNYAQVGRLLAEHFGEDFDTFINNEIKKIIFSLSEASSTILTPPPISDELKQGIQKIALLGDEYAYDYHHNDSRWK